MIRLTVTNTAKAIERCKTLRPKVKFVQDRMYVVYSANNSNVYHVKFDVKDGEKFGACECAASEKRLICYHIAGAAQVNIYRQSLKRQTA